MSDDAEQFSELDQRVRDLLAEVLQVPPATISDDCAMAQIESWDSLRHMELIVSLEQACNIQLTFDEIVAMQSVGAIKRVLTDKGITI